MDIPAKRIAIIGGGLGGLGAIKLCKENGLEPICFEQTDRFGGTWNYRENSVYGVPSIMANTVINHSKEMGALSNFPPRKEYNNFMRHRELFQYAMEYINSSGDITSHCQLNTEVVSVKKSEDYDDTGRWEVAVINSLTGQETVDIYDGVLVCIGHVNRPKMPEYPLQETFKGKIMHTHSLKRVDEFRGQNVVVVGMGCSGLDAAVTSSNVANQVYLSTRSGAYVVSRSGPRGYPIDNLVLRRYLVWFLLYLPLKLVSWVVESVFLDSYFDHRMYAVKPQEPFLCKDPSVNEQIGSKLLSGLVIQKPDIERFTENGVIFKGETEETPADVVIMATGYSWKFPFFVDDIVEKEDNGKINLYKCMFPTQLTHGTLAIIGFLLPFGPGFPLGELQLRWAIHVLSGRGKLPAKHVMEKDVKVRTDANLKRYKYSDKVSIRIDYVEYMDDIASKFGVKPNLFKYFFTDLPLYLKLVFGPSLPYQYRLQGPGKWEGAREAIMTSDDRTLWPLTRRIEPKESWFIKLIKKMLKFVFSD